MPNPATTLSTISLPELTNEYLPKLPALEQVSARLKFFTGERLEGQVQSLSPHDDRIEIRDNDNQVHNLSLSNIRIVQFSNLAHLDNKLVENKDFNVSYRDGLQINGKAFAFMEDDNGLHLLQTDHAGQVNRSFIPHTSIKGFGHHGDQHKQKTEPSPLGKPASNMFPVDDRVKQLAERLGIPYVQLQGVEVDTHSLDMVPLEMAQKYRIFPYAMRKNHLVVAMADPSNSDAVDVLYFISRHYIEITATSDQDIEWAIQHYYYSKDSIDEDFTDAEENGVDFNKPTDEMSEVSQQDVERLGKEKPVVRLVNDIIMRAIRQKASDIHIRPQNKFVELLYRIDGSLVKVRNFSKDILPAIISRIKIIGRMDITERFLPQDGRTRAVFQGKKVDMRISIMPSVNGESAVLRLLDAEAGVRSIDQLGFNEQDAERFVDILNRSYGLILVTGPTGSGKSTTLYAALQELIKRNINIITIEDPVEYHLDGITQLQVRSQVGYTFARALRNILRHDPDAIMVGEIRDHETAAIAVESALTGHVVLSTLHTNDASSTLTRLLEMGLEPYNISSTLLGVFAQRLIRLNCPHCKQEEEVDPSVRKALGVSEDEVFYKGAGCAECHHTGYKGRRSVYELLVMSDAMRELVLKEAPAHELFKKATEQGMVPLTDNALLRAREGVTSLAEVYRVRLQ